LVTRLANFEDVPALQQLIADSVRRLSKDYYTVRQIESAIKYVFGVDSQLLLDRTYYVAEEDKVIIASGGWSKRNTLYGGDQYKEKADPLLDPEKDPARIRAFFVHPEWARKGLGRLILKLCEEAALKNGFTQMTLGATLSGVPLYSAMGYTEIDRTEEIMPDKEVLPIIKMKRNLIFL
jgi:GNAT superfamily N-acetyltransferase